MLRKAWRYYTIALLACIVPALLFVVFFAHRPVDRAQTQCTPSLAMDGTRFRLILARTGGEWEQGLSGHAPLAADEGMLFLFPDNAIRQFWMKDMHFPLDIVWITSDWHVAGWAANALPESYPAIFNSPEPVQYVLEVPAGTMTRFAVGTGTKTIFNDCEK